MDVGRLMKVIVFGSTGGTGRATKGALVAAGHDVTGFARDPSKPAASPAVRAVRGNVMNAADVADADSPEGWANRACPPLNVCGGP